MDRNSLMDRAREFAKHRYEGRGIFNPTEFQSDFNNLLTIRKMLRRFQSSGVINERLLINNIICALNVFGVRKVNVLFLMILDEQQFGMVKSILIFLGQYDPHIGGSIAPSIIMDEILAELRVKYNLQHLCYRNPDE